jgi:hypothetical protein
VVARESQRRRASSRRGIVLAFPGRTPMRPLPWWRRLLLRLRYGRWPRVAPGPREAYR